METWLSGRKRIPAKNLIVVNTVHRFKSYSLRVLLGGVAEWFIAAVLKTAERDERSVSSNLTPTVSVATKPMRNLGAFIG